MNDLLVLTFLTSRRGLWAFRGYLLGLEDRINNESGDRSYREDLCDSPEMGAGKRRSSPKGLGIRLGIGLGGEEGEVKILG